MYCGRELAQGEVCTCPQSAAHRRGSKETNSKTQNKTETNYRDSNHTENSYRTGYAGNDSRFERVKNKYRAKKAARSAAGRGFVKKGFVRAFGKYIWEFIKSPVDKITNPGRLGKLSVMTIAAIQGAVLWLCMYFILRGGTVGPMRFIAAVMSFEGSEGYRMVLQMLICVVSGAASGLILFFLYSGIFYLIDRFIMRNVTRYWDFCVRLVSAWIPFTVICAIGAVLSVFSPVTLLVLVTCGAASVVILTYEALKTEWISKSPGKVMYAMLLGYFVFFTVVWRLFTL